jgi:hypothetical protein
MNPTWNTPPSKRHRGDNAKDKYTYRHVKVFILHYQRKVELGEKEKKTFIYAAYLHDIGKSPSRRTSHEVEPLTR